MASAQILVVEDEIIVAENIRSRLIGLGYTVPAVASSGEEALQKAAETQPDLVLVDIELKGPMDGVEAAEQIRARFDIPVVYLTAYADKDTVRRAKITEPSGYILKPFEVRELHIAIEVALYKHEMERKLRSRERFISRILESIPSSLLTIDRKFRVVSANRNFLVKARRSESETIGRRIEEVFSPAVLASSKLEERITRVFETGEPFGGGQMERLPRLPGRVYFYRVSPLKDEKGEVENVLVLMDDVTEQKRLSEEVRRAERHLASVVDSANDLVVSMDSEGRILTWNRAAERISGLKSDEVKGKHLASLCAEEHQQDMRSLLVRLAKGQFTEKNEVSLRTKDGKEVPIAWACSSMLDDERRIGGLVAVGRDLAERKLLEAQLIKSAKLTSLGVMAGGIAHEIRNPLAISSAAAQLLLESPGDEKLRDEASRKIWSGIQRASYIIENLLRFARPPQERMTLMDISAALEETLSLLANQLRVQRIELRKDLAPGLPPVIGNKTLLQQVFSNMILNACNAMPDGGSLTIATSARPDDQVQIEFADTGCGIPKKDLSNIFDPFFTTMPVGEGTGLGLSISYSIIKEHQGTVDVESKPGMGSTFTIRLPIGTDQERRR
ncbi:MAG: PAS domain S-box protein [Chloroflexota bacterium]